MPNHCHHRRRNYVLLLRHCVRSTQSRPTIKVCDGDYDANTNSNSTAHNNDNNTTAKSRRANVTEYIKAPCPEWGVPSLQCTERGMSIIRRLGHYLVDNVINATPNTHVVVHIISDDSHCDVDTLLALTKSMKYSLENVSPFPSFSGRPWEFYKVTMADLQRYLQKKRPNYSYIVFLPGHDVINFHV